MKPYYEDTRSGITIYHGDCREILPQLGRFDLLLTDPPYGIGADEAAAKKKGKWGWKYYGESAWDRARPSNDVLRAALDRAGKAVIWGGNYFADALPVSMGWLVWNKGQRDFSLADGELAWTSEEKALRIFDYSRAAALQDGKQHPTQKPLALMKWCLGFFPEAKSVLDAFMGSGTTLVAAKETGRSAIGIEREEKYCEVAAKRLSQEVLFGPMQTRTIAGEEVASSPGSVMGFEFL